MQFKVEESKNLEDGKHDGVIIAVEYRDAPFKYADVIIETENMKLKVGYPAFVASKSKFGQLLALFGAELKIGEKVDPEKILVGKKCSFLTMLVINKKNGKTYTNIVAESLKPLV